ncbi:gamma-glutamyl peptidase 1-like [Amborella trichopoda]|uniref:Glutamine amidotransferase domain-containing protein n=1 Tax=Amborella trichopoda TaxID=13333 RepID=W1PXL7_AMBTC|nr:gamma-glutamyl peptidase 1-like [Amborella trichopoda]ERN12631.1 hypothetical protein AMTR_s00025p00234180 [Amborella trichopoda]|eukprot:XP_020527126.1 gamma-glutamyl peptidase 1-like [Amborella trichopoda]
MLASFSILEPKFNPNARFYISGVYNFIEEFGFVEGMSDPCPMKFGLLVPGLLNSHFADRHGTSIEIFKRFLKEAAEVWDSFLVVNGDFCFFDSIDECTGFVITGNASDAHCNDSWNLQICQALKHLHHLEKMILGICFGHQYSTLIKPNYSNSARGDRLPGPSRSF